MLDAGLSLPDPEASRIYAAHCAGCHEKGVPKAPLSIRMQQLGPDLILDALESGVMKPQGDLLSADERLLLAEVLGAGTARATELPPPMCERGVSAFDRTRPPELSGWGFAHSNSRFIPAGVARLSPEDVPRLRLKWAFAYPGALRARSQPAIAGGAAIVGSADGRVYALDLERGCARWVFQAKAEVRSGVAINDWTADGTPPRAYFGDFRGNAYAIDARTGKPVWTRRVNEHPDTTLTGSVRLFEGRLYVPLSSNEWASAGDPGYPCCSFRGGVVALDAASGQEVWRSYTIEEAAAPTGKTNAAGTPLFAPAGAPVWSSPTIDAERRRLYIGTGEGYTSPAAATSDAILALDLDTGKRLWSYQAQSGDAWNISCFMGSNANCPAENGPDLDFGAPPVLATRADGSSILLAGQKASVVHAIDPDDGTLLWKRRLSPGNSGGGIHWGMAVDGGVLYAPINDQQAYMFDGEQGRPGLDALDIENGNTLWSVSAPETCTEDDAPGCDPGFSAAVTAIPGAVFAGSLDGHLRAYAAEDGNLLWEVDTATEYETVSGQVARGGSVESDGAVVYNGLVLINSGYTLGLMPGNLLLAFEVPDAS